MAAVVAGLLLVSGAGTAAAESGEAGISAATDVPVHTGARLDLELPARLRASVSLGVMPRPYVELINRTAQSFGWYDQATGDVIADALEQSLIARFHVGVRPFSELGLYVDGGYTVAALGGGATGGELITAATGIRVPSSMETEFGISSTLHLLDLRVGYRFNLSRSWTLTTDAGFMTTVASQTRVTPPIGGALMQSVARGLEQYLDSTFTSYVHTPYVGLSVGYSFPTGW